MLCDAEAAAALRQVRRINDEVVSVVAIPIARRWIAPSLLDEISRWPVPLGPEYVWDWPGIFAQLETDARRSGLEIPPGSIRTSGQLLAMADEFSWAWDAGTTPPPAPPPLAGRIERLLGDKELVAEGRLMRHCVGRYRRKARAGRRLVYRVLPDRSLGVDRATLALRPDASTMSWQVDQLCGERNRCVSPATMGAVAAWLIEAH